MARPVIAVSAPLEEMSTAFGAKDCTKLTAAYTHAIYAAGGQPVIVPVVDQPPRELLVRMDGLMLTGGGDLDPTLYGEAPDPNVYGIRRDRDAFESALYREAVSSRMPVLGICRGMQLINVLRGGNLLQHIEEHWQTDPADQATHSLDVDPDSTLSRALGGVAGKVNSYHHQALDQLGADLRVTAWCGDVIEAVEATDADIVCVQWHPEHMANVDPAQHALFEQFVQRAAAYRNRQNSTTPQHEEKDLCPTK